MYLLCGCGALLFINSATLLLIDNAALLLISVKKEMLKLISGRKSIRDTSYLVLHFCSHSGSLKHWPVLEELLTRLQFLEIRISYSNRWDRWATLTFEGEAKGWGTLSVEVTRRREMRRDTCWHIINSKWWKSESRVKTWISENWFRLERT